MTNPTDPDRAERNKAIANAIFLGGIILTLSFYGAVATGSGKGDIGFLCFMMNLIVIFLSPGPPLRRAKPDWARTDWAKEAAKQPKEQEPKQ